MKVTVTENSPIERTMEVVVEAARVDESFDKAFRKAVRYLSVPGFRKGKVPARLAQRHIKDSSLAGEVLEDVVPRAFHEALRQEGLEPITEARWDIGDSERGKDLSFKATFEVKPHVALDDYKGLEITQEKQEVTDGDVEEVLERIRQRHAQLVPMEGGRGLREGDLALVDFTGTENGEPLPGGTAENYPMELTPANYVKGFLDNLYGMTPGEQREFEVDFPEDYPSDLAGRHVHFRFDLHEIKERKAPGLDDAFAQDVSDCQTVEELRTQIRDRMEAENLHHAEHGVAQQLFRRLEEQIHEDEVPPALVVQKARLYTAEVMRDLQRGNRKLEDLLKDQGWTQEQWSNHALNVGYAEARNEILVESLARLEGLAVEESDLDPHLEEQAGRTNQPRSTVRQKLEEEGTLGLLKSHILRHKVMHLLVEAAQVTYVPPAEPTEASEEAEESSDQAPEEAGAAVES